MKEETSMYKIIMVDDEPWALKGIRDIIDWKLYGFTDIRTFGNPIEALEAIQEDCPDVVCTDVRMSGLSGLELMERYQKVGKSPLFVVISAYAEFEYAKRAMDSGAFSYILKPLEESKILKLAEKLQSTLHHNQIERSVKSINKLVIQALTSERTVQLDPSIEQSGIFSSPYQICITDTVTRTINVPWFRIYDDLAMAVLPECNDIQVPSLCGYSRTAQSGDEVGQRIREALISYYTLRYYGEKARGLVYQAGSNYIMKEGEEIIRSVSTGKTHHARALLDNVQTRAKEQRLMIDEMTFFYNSVLQGVISRYPKKGLQETLHAFSSCFQMYSIMQTEEMMFKSLSVLINDSIEKSFVVADASDTLMRVVHYVDTHYTEMINLELLSEQFNISLSHLCRQFKRIAGASFTEYVTKKRITQACELLRYTQQPVSNIGMQVGYPDYFHFNKVFKKVVGVSPSTYRKEGCDDVRS